MQEWNLSKFCDSSALKLLLSGYIASFLMLNLTFFKPENLNYPEKLVKYTLI